MKTKQTKEDLDKSVDEEAAIEPKKRGRKRAVDPNEDEKKQSLDEPKTSQVKRNPPKSRGVMKNRPLGIRKTLRSKTATANKNVVKNLKQSVGRGKKVAAKEPNEPLEKVSLPLISASEIKKEPIDDSVSSSRSSSPRTASRKQRLSSDVLMMKSVLSDSPNSVVLGPRTSPYSMRSERSDSPSLLESKSLRRGGPRKVKANLLNEVVLKEQQKRRRLQSDSKSSDLVDASEEVKKLKRDRSCSAEGSEISKCSDITESDISLTEAINDAGDINKKTDKPKTDVDVDVQNSLQMTIFDKVPSVFSQSKPNEPKTIKESNCIIGNKNSEKQILKRSLSLDSDNNNSNKIKLENFNSSDIEKKLLIKTESDILLEARSSILTSMSKAFNTKRVAKNIRKTRRGRKAGGTTRAELETSPKNSVNCTIISEPVDVKQETLETLSKEIDDLITDLDQNINRDNQNLQVSNLVDNTQTLTKSVNKFYGLSKPLGDNNSIHVETSKDIKEDPTLTENEVSQSKDDDSENIRLHYEDDSCEKPVDGTKQDITYKCSTVASIDKLMDRLKEFEEFDKRRQRQETEVKVDLKTVMVTDDVVLIPKSGADIKLKDIQSVRSPEQLMEKENLLSCFENNSAISIVKREHVRKSLDVDLPNSITLIKRNSVNSRKDSTNSNHSKDDAISIFEKSLGKDVTLTEIRKSVDKPPPLPVELNQFATLHLNNNLNSMTAGLDSHQISIIPRLVSEVKVASNETVSKNSKDTSKLIESSVDEKISLEVKKSPNNIKPSDMLLTQAPVAVKSPESVPMETEALAPPLENIKPIPEDINSASESQATPETTKLNLKPETTENETKLDTKIENAIDQANVSTQIVETKLDTTTDVKLDKVTTPKRVKSPPKTKSTRNSTECQAGPSSMLHETPESQKRKENILRTLGLLTHKAAKEAKIEKQKEKERIYSGIMKNKAGKSNTDYTGTLKTVIKLNRGSGRLDNEKKRYRSSLKMTFQKSKNRAGKPLPELGDVTEVDEYYTIERKEMIGVAAADGGLRKSHHSNRLNNHEMDITPESEAVPDPEPSKESPNLVIPEKASSFSIHPGRLCMDQCFYCGGKFGLFDTPCHIAQMKSGERQRKVLDNEEKLTIDSCLCDACYRHVDRRANCPSYRRRPAARAMLQGAQPATQPGCSTEGPADKTEDSPPLEEESEEDLSGNSSMLAGARSSKCHTAGCAALAERSIRRKWLIKMRSSVSKLLQLETHYPGLHTIPLCGEHYRALAPLMACALCRRALAKHHGAHLVHSYLDINPLLETAGIPVTFSDRPLLCKLCRYYCTLLQRPGHNDKHARAYRRKLLQLYNIEVPTESDHEIDELAIQQDMANKQRKKARAKSKQRKSSDPEKADDVYLRTSESPNDKDVQSETVDGEAPKGNIEEDIESLISSNKILVPGANKAPSEVNTLSDSSETEAVFELETPVLPIDKQTELQYLLQKQNNPAQFLHKPNQISKSKNVFKVGGVQGVHKAGSQHKSLEKSLKRIQKLGQSSQKQLLSKKEQIDLTDILDPEKCKETGVTVLKNMPLSDECTIENVTSKKQADINTLKCKWQMSESFTQVKKNISELSKKLTVEKEPKKVSDTKYTNPVKRLETNPSISVRELFPGEDELNLQCSVDFNNLKGITPEGWERCNTTIQYDVETKKLWCELQRPYGNQSSFLRHLVLLEKYFRNGDLVLSNNASLNAINYSDSVQNRLRAYDNVINDAPKRPESSVSLLEFRKKPNSKSLLKSNNLDDNKKVMPPPQFPKSKLPKAVDKKQKPLPPELIAINNPKSQGRKGIQNVLHNIQQLVKGVSASDPIEIASSPLPPRDAVKDKKESKGEAPKKHKTTSKPWRPTLMPITAENLARIALEPTQIAVDGRQLPSLVQVISSGKRYHITLQDYNKMCIMRREKLQQVQDGESRCKKSPIEPDTLITEIHPSTLLGNGGAIIQTVDKLNERKDEMSELTSNAASILKNVGLKNITIAPIPPKTTVGPAALPRTSSPYSAASSLPNVKLPQGLSIGGEGYAQSLSTQLVMPKIPKSLTVIPQTVVPPAPHMAVQQMTVTALPQSANVPQNMAAVPQSLMAVKPSAVTMSPNVTVTQSALAATQSVATVPQMVTTAPLLVAAPPNAVVVPQAAVAMPQNVVTMPQTAVAVSQKMSQPSPQISSDSQKP